MSPTCGETNCNNRGFCAGTARKGELEVSIVDSSCVCKEGYLGTNCEKYEAPDLRPYITDWWSCFNEENWCYTDRGFMTGLYTTKATNSGIFRIEEVESKDALPELDSEYDCYEANWWDCFDNNNSWCKCNDGYYMKGLFRSNKKDERTYKHALNLINEAKCCRPVKQEKHWGDCREHDVSTSFHLEGWSKCEDGYYMAGLFKGG